MFSTVRNLLNDYWHMPSNNYILNSKKADPLKVSNRRAWTVATGITALGGVGVAAVAAAGACVTATAAGAVGSIVVAKKVCDWVSNATNTERNDLIRNIQSYLDGNCEDAPNLSDGYSADTWSQSNQYKKYLDDEEIASLLVKCDVENFRYLSDRIKKLHYFCRETVSENPRAFLYTGWCDAELAVDAMAQNGMLLGKVVQMPYRKWCGSNKDVVRAAFSENVHSLKFADVKLRNDAEYFCSLLNKCDAPALIPSILNYVEKGVLNSKKVMRLAISLNSAAVEKFTSSELFKDFDFIKELCEEFPNTRNVLVETGLPKNSLLVLLSEEKMQDIDLVKQALSDHSQSKELIEIAINLDPSAFSLASAELKKDLAYVVELCEKYPEIREGLVKAAIPSLPGAAFLSGEMQLEENEIREILSVNPDALQFAPNAVKGDIRMVAVAVEKKWSTMRHASQEIRDHFNTVEALLEYVSRNTLTKAPME